MLARMAMASPSPIPATRGFSTALRLRIASSKPLFDADAPSSSSRGPTARSNPLVGSYVPAEPRPGPDSASPGVSVPPPPPPPPASAAPAIPESPGKQARAYDALSPSNITIDLASILSEKASSYVHNRGAPNPMDNPKVRTKAVSGRTVFIQDRLSPTSAPTPMMALRVLDKMCRDQKIKNKFHSQKFHERKGLKKKRLRSQRWRARFKTGFKAAVNRVMELKKQGW
ncbi:Ribosomal protein S21 [Metarhizium album ARSEF 1941]|uniref:Ribosomal protein S21 n=1 Tax=Metarhizium album (strain ARSEF 1941) TaxID=1081103 RepID=A0A0B2WRF7_METAS|nr:Ribosomal protein S21 [Metarhizium album ARSEF 1941]KHN96194.1 Ribosomal protein S21 [Metarhizium album ARSEF 1941]